MKTRKASSRKHPTTLAPLAPLREEGPGEKGAGIPDKTILAKTSQLLALVSLLTCLLVGCNQDSGPSAQDLLRRQQLRESAKLSKGKTIRRTLGQSWKTNSPMAISIAGQEAMRHC